MEDQTTFTRTVETPIFTPDEAGEYLRMRQLGVSDPAETLRYLIKTRQIRHTKIAGRVAFHREHLDEYATRHDPTQATNKQRGRAL